MWTKTFSGFLSDEQGGYTLWSVAWFIVYAGLGGLAVDVTDAYRHETQLQATADAAALAAIMSVDEPGGDPIAQANFYGGANMNPSHNGDVLVDADVTLGVWDFTTRTFTAGATPTNAVHVATRRATENDNPVGMNFLRILGLFGLNTWWDVATEAVAVGAVSSCHNNGLIAGNRVSQTSGNSFFANMCVHGVQGLSLGEGDYFESGVATSTTCTDCVEPNDPSGNEGWDEAWWRGGPNEPLFPFNADAVVDYVDVLRALPDTSSYADMLSTYGRNYADWAYLFHPDGSPPTLHQGSTLPDTLQPYTVYDIGCSGQIGLPTTPVRNAAIVTTCRIHVPASATMDLVDVALAVDLYPSNPSNNGIHIAGNGIIGNTDCNSGGVEIYTTGSSIHFAAGGDVNDVRLISGWNIDWAANATGRVGVAAEAVNDITLRTNTDFGLCPGGTANGAKQLTYRLVL